MSGPIKDRTGQSFPTVTAAVASALSYSRAYATGGRLAEIDLMNLQNSLDAILASAAYATITPELGGAGQQKEAA